VSLAETLADQASAPDFHGAACADPATRLLFDTAAGRDGPTVTARRTAITICQGCPVLQAFPTRINHVVVINDAETPGDSHG
jgi:hypothetical protein